MLRCILIYLFTCLLSVSYAQPVFEWAIGLEGDNNDNIIHDIEVADGVIYTAGNWRGNLDFDPTPGTFFLQRNPMFAATYDTTGQLIWPFGIQAPHQSACRAIVTDDSGQYYLGGSFEDYIYLDPATSTKSLQAISVYQDIFVAKYEPFGQLIWAFGLGGIASGGEILDMAGDGTGNIYIAGSFADEIDFDPDTSQYTMTSNGLADAFVAKYSPSGNLIWARSGGGSKADFVKSISVDNHGNLYLAGEFTDSLDLMNKSGNVEYSLMSNGNIDAFVISYDSAGNLRWASSFGSALGDYSSVVRTTNTGNIFVAGIHNDTLDIDPGPSRTTIGVPGANGAFVAKFDTTGSFIWGFSIGNNSYLQTRDLEIDNTSNLYLSGQFDDSLDFDPGVGISVNGKSGNYLAKYDAFGNHIWNVSYNYGDRSPVFLTMAGTDIYLAGRFDDTSDFDPGPGTFLLPASDQYSLYISKLHCESVYDTVYASICSGDSYLFEGEEVGRAGRYTRTYPAATACDSSIILFLSVVADASVTRPDHKTLQATNPQATYQWVDCDNGHAPIPGATAQAFTPAVNGTYAVVVTEAGCTDTSACYAVTSIGVDAGPAAVPLTVYPNPAREQVHLSFYLPEATNTTIRLYDYQGRAVFTKDLAHSAGHQAVTRPVGHLPAGMYHVLLRTEHGSAVRKVVVQR